MTSELHRKRRASVLNVGAQEYGQPQILPPMVSFPESADMFPSSSVELPGTEYPQAGAPVLVRPHGVAKLISAPIRIGPTDQWFHVSRLFTMFSTAQSEFGCDSITGSSLCVCYVNCLASVFSHFYYSREMPDHQDVSFSFLRRAPPPGISCRMALKAQLAMHFIYARTWPNEVSIQCLSWRSFTFQTSFHH
jgi:hypothetical protein